MCFWIEIIFRVPVFDHLIGKLGGPREFRLCETGRIAEPERNERLMDRLTIRIQKDHPDARLPEFAHGPGEDAGMDLFSAEEVILPPGTWASVGTGLKIELPPGYDGQLRPRSGLASEYGVTLLNAPGTIDPGYRGEVRVLMINHGDRGYTIWPGDKIAQLVVGSYAAVEWEVAEQLTESKRGDGGFGSTGD